MVRGRRPIRDFWLAGGLAAAVVLAGCAPGLPFGNKAPVEAHHAPHWTYEGEDGPQHWGELGPDYDLCSAGKQQSPIDISPSRLLKADWLLPLEVRINPTKLNVVNNGHTIQVNYDKGSSFIFEKQGYTLKQFHFHSPSEHKIGGVAFDMETHLVWSTPDSKLAVIGFMITASQENPFFAKFFHALPDKANTTVTRELNINVKEVLPETRDYFHYDGSLTTPPCAEGVKWIVLKTPVQASRDQISRFRAVVGDHNTNRPVQQVNERLVKEAEPSTEAAQAPAAGGH